MSTARWKAENVGHLSFMGAFEALTIQATGFAGGV